MRHDPGQKTINRKQRSPKKTNKQTKKKTVRGEPASQSLCGNFTKPQIPSTTGQDIQGHQGNRGCGVQERRQRVEEREDPNPREQTRCERSLLDHVEVVSVVSLVDDVLLRFDQHLKHGVQDLGELLLKKAVIG